MKRLVFALLTLLVFSSPVEAKRKIRVLYWNVQNGMWADQDKNYDNFVRFVQELNPDVCVWCEAESRYKDNVRDKIEGRHEAYLPYNWEMLARRYGHEYAYIAGKRDDFPQIITSKVPVRIVKRINGEKDGIQVVHGSGLASMPLGRGRDSLYIITVHTYPFKYSYGAEDQKKSAAEGGGDRYREQELRYIVSQTLGEQAKNAKGYWMMVGDFNAVSRMDNWKLKRPEDDTAFLACDYMANETCFKDALGLWTPGVYQYTTLSQRRIDYVFCTPKLYDKIKSIKVLREGFAESYRDPIAKPFCRNSDHYPILVDFEF